MLFLETNANSIIWTHSTFRLLHEKFAVGKYAPTSPHSLFLGLPKWRQNRVENNIWLWWQNFFHVVAKTRACVWVASTPCLCVCVSVCSHVGVCCYLCGRTTLQLVGGAGNTRRPGSKIAGSTKSWRALYVHKNIPAAHGLCECVSTCVCVCGNRNQKGYLIVPN